jgi:Flp pilus assembly protein TadB
VVAEVAVITALPAIVAGAVLILHPALMAAVAATQVAVVVIVAGNKKAP